MIGVASANAATTLADINIVRIEISLFRSSSSLVAMEFKSTTSPFVSPVKLASLKRGVWPPCIDIRARLDFPAALEHKADPSYGFS
jgi:hypothetical protein